MNYDFSFGSDPEFILTKGGRYYSAIGVVQGDREKRINIRGHEFYYDNVLAEAAIRPGKTRREFVENVRECLSLYADLVRPYKLMLQASHDFPNSQMQTKEAREVGCNQEWCAYSLQVIPPPKEIMLKTNFRTAGGHIHLGGGGILQNSWEKPFVVYMLDLFLALPSVFMDKDKSAKERRTMYGQAGSHRDTPYGLEYRPLGPFWLGSPRQVELVWDICNFVLNFVANRSHLKFWKLDEELLDSDDPSVAYECFGYDKEALRRTINGCDKKAAKTFMLFIEQFMPHDLVVRIKEDEEEGTFYKKWGLE